MPFLQCPLSIGYLESYAHLLWIHKRKTKQNVFVVLCGFSILQKKKTVCYSILSAILELKQRVCGRAQRVFYYFIIRNSASTMHK